MLHSLGNERHYQLSTCLPVGIEIVPSVWPEGWVVQSQCKRNVYVFTD